MIRAAQIQDVANLVAVLHASIRSCIQDHQRNEAKIQAWLENKSYENILMLLHYNNCWVYVLQHVVVGFIMISDRGQILQHAGCAGLSGSANLSAIRSSSSLSG